MRASAIGLVVSALSLAAWGCSSNDRVRVESFTPGPDGNFVYSARINTVMTPNDDGVAEQIRRDWLAETLAAQGRCPSGYVVYRRALVIPPQRLAYPPPPDELTFGNSGDVVYGGACL